MTRLLAGAVLLLYGGVFGAGSVLDGHAAARANASIAHVEAGAGADCAAHDEATCQICRVATTGACSAPLHFATPTAARSLLSGAETGARIASVAAGALHSRAPPRA
ncbi:MAG: hypothetical protein ACT4R6_02545 [Gemmatimonadaceae bacterium]